MKNIVIKSNHPAKDWNEAFPLGNGYMGAMCFGGNMVDRFQINNDSLWYGKFRDRVNPDAHQRMEQVKGLIAEGRICEAEELANEALAAIPDYQCHYEPLCDLFLLEETEARVHILGLKDGWNDEISRFLPCEQYERMLNMEQGIHRVSYEKEGISYLRETFLSYPDRVMVIHTVGKNFRAILERGFYSGDITRDGNTLYMNGQAGGDGVRYTIGLRCIEGFEQIIGRTMHCMGESVLLLASQTSFYSDQPERDVKERLAQAESRGLDQLRKRHIEDVSALMNRCELEIEGQNQVCQAFNYGRYLLIASSRPGSLPANLQGVWNQDYLPAWDSKYTININTEMNYWPAEVCNLSELTEPLFTHMKRMLPHGREVARKMYGVSGFMAHHNTDIWGDCAPQDTWPSSTYWQMGAIWLCIHIIEHFRYTQDNQFLSEYMPMIKEAILFFENTLVENEDGELVVSPTTSPENSYRLENGESGNMCMGAAMDSQILRELLIGVLETQLLTPEERARYKDLLCRLSKDKIGKDGRLLEWAKPYEELEPGHRHISHLFGIYPGTTLLKDDLKLAAEKTLETRLHHGGGHTGWSSAWIVCLYARLGDGDKAFKIIRKYFEQSVLPNGFCSHPPFQIDGNFGITAGIAEMLMQSQENEIRLLPALPEEWKNGFVRGLCARGGQKISFSWKDGKVLSPDEA